MNAERWVSADARIAVEAAIAKVGYVRNTAARNLKTQQSHAIGLIVHEPHSLFLSASPRRRTADTPRNDLALSHVQDVGAGSLTK